MNILGAYPVVIVIVEVAVVAVAVAPIVRVVVAKDISDNGDRKLFQSRT